MTSTESSPFSLSQDEMKYMLIAGAAAAGLGFVLGGGYVPYSSSIPQPVQFGIAGAVGYYISRVAEKKAF